MFEHLRGCGVAQISYFISVKASISSCQFVLYTCGPFAHATISV